MLGRRRPEREKSRSRDRERGADATGARRLLPWRTALDNLIADGKVRF